MRADKKAAFVTDCALVGEGTIWTQSPENVLVAGHRGFSDKYPENTLVSFQAAIDAGVDMLELDIQLTADDELIVIHDETVDRTTNGKGPVSEKTLEQIRALDASVCMGEQFGATPIPTYLEFLEMVKPYPNLLYNFEIKEYPKNGNEERAYKTADMVLELISKYNLTDYSVICAFDATLLQYINDKYGKRIRLQGFYPLLCMNMTETDRDPYSYLYSACTFAESCEPFDYLRSKGVQPWVGDSVVDEETVREALSYSAPLITCNNPESILGILKKLGYHK
jgi:glycerophosphoryl diester phosphodiesterase